MDSEDDICVLQHSDDDDIEADTALIPPVPFSPFTQAVPSDVDNGSHFALKKAYLTLKQKLDDTAARNQQLVQRIQELESSSKNRDLDSFVNIGESFDMMEDARYVAESRAGLQLAGGAVVGAGESSVASNMGQQLMVGPQSQAEGVETRSSQYKEKMPEMNQALTSLNQQVALLRQENIRLHQGWEAERTEKEAALLELREKCNSLQLERDKAVKESTSLLASLQKANQELAILKEKQGEGVSAEPPPELLNEMVHMRQVIDKLKMMVLMQKDCLVNRSMSLSRTSLNSSPHNAPSMEPHSSPGGSHSGHSWEMVNGVVTAPTDPRQQRLQQRSAKMMGVELGPRHGSPAVNPTTLGQPGVGGGGNAGKAVASNNQSGPAPNGQNGAAVSSQSRPAVSSTGGPRQAQQSAGVTPKPRTEVIYRRHSEVDVHQPTSKPAEAPRAHTLPQQAPRLADWMGHHYQQHPQPQGTMATQAAVGLNQFMNEAPNALPASGIVVSGQVVGSPSRPSQPMEVQYPPAAAHYLPRQPSPLSQPNSGYDNVTFTPPSATSANSNGTIVPSMHILNQGSMTGARVLRNNSGGFSNEGNASSDPRPVVMVGINRDGAGFRRPPQEHSDDLTRPQNPTDLQMTQEIRFANELPSGQNESNLDRKCPVCSQDFGNIPMDEFQTHVFECFDDADDSSNAPETLQPQQGHVGQRSECNGRICPMCEKSFADNISQDFFESHVQSHFEDVVNHFEVLNAHQT